MKRKSLILICALIGCVGLMLSKPIYNYVYNRQTVDGYQKLKKYSVKPLKSTAEARKKSQQQLTATIVYRPECETCHDTIKQLLQNSSQDYKYLPFNIANGDEPKVKALMEQLNSKQVPSVVVWEKGEPAFVFVCDGSKQSVALMIKVLHGINIDNHDQKITRINQTAYYFHNDKSKVISRNEIIPLR